jgi:hypothetical protein
MTRFDVAVLALRLLALTMLALGLVLFLGGTGLSAFWYWVRNAGLGARPGRPA